MKSTGREQTHTFANISAHRVDLVNQDPDATYLAYLGTVNVEVDADYEVLINACVATWASIEVQ